jgi:hypothetical protein
MDVRTVELRSLRAFAQTSHGRVLKDRPQERQCICGLSIACAVMLTGRAKKAALRLSFPQSFSMADKIVRSPFRAGVLKKHTPL